MVDESLVHLQFRCRPEAKELAESLASEAGLSGSDALRLFLSIGMQAYRTGIRSSDEMRSALDTLAGAQ